MEIDKIWIIKTAKEKLSSAKDDIGKKIAAVGAAKEMAEPEEDEDAGHKETGDAEQDKQEQEQEQGQE